MTRNQKNPKAVERKDATAELLTLVRKATDLIEQSNKYSTSAIYAAHNAVFGLDEIPQTCSSCLLTRGNALRSWLHTEVPTAKPVGKTGEGVQTQNPITGAQTGQLPGDSKPAVDNVAAVNEPATLSAWLQDEFTKREVADTLDARKDALELIFEDETITDEQREYAATTYDAIEAQIAAANAVEPQYVDPGAPGFVAPAKGVMRYPMGEGIMPFDFTPSEADENKGTVKAADGANVKAGTYTAATGHTIAVSIGGKATIKGGA